MLWQTNSLMEEWDMRELAFRGPGSKLDSTFGSRAVSRAGTSRGGLTSTWQSMDSGMIVSNRAGSRMGGASPSGDSGVLSPGGRSGMLSPGGGSGMLSPTLSFGGGSVGGGGGGLSPLPSSPAMNISGKFDAADGAGEDAEAEAAEAAAAAEAAEAAAASPKGIFTEAPKPPRSETPNTLQLHGRAPRIIIFQL